MMVLLIDKVGPAQLDHLLDVEHLCGLVHQDGRSHDTGLLQRPGVQAGRHLGRVDGRRTEQADVAVVDGKADHLVVTGNGQGIYSHDIFQRQQGQGPAPVFEYPVAADGFNARGIDLLDAYLVLDLGDTQKVYRGLSVACIRNNYGLYLIKEGVDEMRRKGC
jgi:hypothetical protein